MISDFGFRISDWRANPKFKILRLLTYFRPVFSIKAAHLQRANERIFFNQIKGQVCGIQWFSHFSLVNLPFLLVTKMNLNLTGYNALVGGSSKGIGRAVAVELALLGANVTLVARNAERLSEAMEQLDASKGQQHDFLVADFANAEDLHKKVHGLVSGRPIHILVNNTGGPPGGPASTAQVGEFLQAFNNHLIGNHTLMQLVLPGMKGAGFGRIINIISTSVKQPIEGLGVSNTIRGAVANWAKTLATELGPHGITVNNVLPGATMTGRLEEIANANAAKSGSTADAVFEHWQKEIPLRRIADPSEVAAAVAFLASPAASYISGINLPVDGGRTKSL
jgi:3-oxoacyl-[acyl-carrier protein] reductase